MLLELVFEQIGFEIQMYMSFKWTFCNYDFRPEDFPIWLGSMLFFIVY